jgi:hypothetical protein
LVAVVAVVAGQVAVTAQMVYLAVQAVVVVVLLLLAAQLHNALVAQEPRVKVTLVATVHRTLAQLATLQAVVVVVPLQSALQVHQVASVEMVEQVQVLIQLGQVQLQRA